MYINAQVTNSMVVQPGKPQTTKSSLSNIPSPFIAQKSTLTEQQNLETLKNRLKKMQVEQDLQNQSLRNMNKKKQALEGIHSQTEEYRRFMQSLRLKQEQESEQLRNQNMGYFYNDLIYRYNSKKQQQKRHISDIKTSLFEMKHKEMQEVASQRKLHEEIIQKAKEEELMNKRQQKQSVLFMLEKSREKTGFYFKQKLNKNQTEKNLQVESSQQQRHQTESQLEQIRRQEELLRQKNEELRMNKSRIKQEINSLTNKSQMEGSKVFQNSHRSQSQANLLQE